MNKLTMEEGKYGLGLTKWKYGEKIQRNRILGIKNQVKT